MSAARPSSTEFDSIRVGARDLLLVLRQFRSAPETTLENVRLQLCVDREKPRRGELFATTARDVAVELQKLGLAKGGPYPKAKSDYERLKEKPIRSTGEGRALLEKFEGDPASAYDALFSCMFAAHRYLRDYVRVLGDENLLLAPVLTSFKDHVAPEYASAPVMREEIMTGRFRTPALLASMEKRLKRPLTEVESAQIRKAIDELIHQTRANPTGEDTTVFAKAILSRLNDIIVPAVLGTHGLGFDYRTHRAIWSLGEQFLTWWATPAHPSYEGTIIFPTAKIRCDAAGQRVEAIEFPASLSKLRDSFLPRLHQTYLGLQKLGRGSLVSAQELRAAYCMEHCCQPSTFDKLFNEQHTREDTPFEIHTEIQQQRPRHGNPLRAGNRNVGLVLVSKK